MGELKKCIVYPASNLFDRFDHFAPFYKHEFWSEENETRALISIKNNSNGFQSILKDKEGSYYYDMNITSNCIKKIILGHEFSEDNIREMNSIHGAIDFEGIKLERSKGTNVLTSRYTLKCRE